MSGWSKYGYESENDDLEDSYTVSIVSSVVFALSISVILTAFNAVASSVEMTMSYQPHVNNPVSVSETTRLVTKGKFSAFCAIQILSLIHI